MVAELLDRCRTLGIDPAPGPGGALLWEADADPPTDLLRELAEHKPALLALLASRPAPEPWDPEAADVLAFRARQAREAHGYSADPGLREEQHAAATRLDECCLARDLPGVRVAAEELIDLLRAGVASSSVTSDSDDASIHPKPPPGARLYCQAADARIVGPGDPDVYMWTFEGAGAWFYAKDHPVPGQQRPGA
jgi:hypothetical protein